VEKRLDPFGILGRSLKVKKYAKTWFYVMQSWNQK
jgi:hypothetical protein